MKLTSRTLGLVTIASPAPDPGPVTTLRVPAGQPASSMTRANSSMLTGVWMLDLATMVLPARSAGVILAAGMNNG